MENRQFEDAQRSKNNGERFIALVAGYMGRISKEFNPQPLVGGIRVNLFAVYYLVTHMGGLEKVLADNNLQAIAAKVGITNKQHLNDFIHMYYAYLYPFEQYAKSQDGIREFQQRMNQPPQQQPLHHQQHQQQHHEQNQLQTQPQPQPPVNAPFIQIDISDNISWDLNPNDKPEYLKIYNPLNFYQDRTNGIDLMAIDQLGEKIDDLKPVFLYLPEIGRIDIKALSLALQSGIDAEVNNSLNQLLIITTDDSIKLDLNHCPDLLSSLCSLSGKIINSLMMKTSNKNNNEFNKSDKNDPVSLIDSVFAKYTNGIETKNQNVEIDSFSSKQITKLPPIDLNIKLESHNETTQSLLKQSSQSTNLETLAKFALANNNITSNFKLTNYVDLIHECNVQSNQLILDIDNESPLSHNLDIHSKSWSSRRIMLMEQLSTISLIIRNLSFIGNNNLIMGSSQQFIDFLLCTIFAGILSDEDTSFKLFKRKKLMLLKDAIIILVNTCHAIKFQNEFQMLLLVLLSFTFGPNISQNNENLITSKVNPKLNKYYAHSIDIILKSITSNDSNFKLLSNLVLGKIPNEYNEIISKILTGLYGSCYNAFNQRKLLKNIFSIFISALPLNSIHQGVNQFNERPQIILESLLGCLLLIDIINDDIKSRNDIMDKLNDPNFENDDDLKLPDISNLSLELLTSYENLGLVLNHLCFMYACIFVNGPANERRNEQVHISARSIELINKLIDCSIESSKISMNKPKINELIKLYEVNKLFGSNDHLIGMLMTMDIPQTILLQVIESFNLSNKLKQLIK